MEIITKYDEGDVIIYDEIKKGRIIGYEISGKEGIRYVISAEKDDIRPSEYYSDVVYLANRGSLRHENEITLYHEDGSFKTE